MSPAWNAIVSSIFNKNVAQHEEQPVRISIMCNHERKTAIEKDTVSKTIWADSIGALPVIKPFDELEEL